MRDTSRAAHERIRPSALVLRERVARFVEARGVEGATDQEVQIGLAMSGNTQRPRRWELMHDGRLKDSGATRTTRKGRAAIVWVYVHDEDERTELRRQQVRDYSRTATDLIGEIGALNERLAGCASALRRLGPEWAASHIVACLEGRADVGDLDATQGDMFGGQSNR